MREEREVMQLGVYKGRGGVELVTFWRYDVGLVTGFLKYACNKRPRLRLCHGKKGGEGSSRRSVAPLFGERRELCLLWISLLQSIGPTI